MNTSQTVILIIASLVAVAVLSYNVAMKMCDSDHCRKSGGYLLDGNCYEHEPIKFDFKKRYVDEQ